MASSVFLCVAPAPDGWGAIINLGGVRVNSWAQTLLISWKLASVLAMVVLDRSFPLLPVRPMLEPWCVE